MCSDGLAEARNGAMELFGFERLGEVIRQGCAEGLSAEELTERVFARVAAFCETDERTDDQTVVVVAVQG